MKKSKDTTIPLSGLVEYVIDGLATDVTGYELEFYDWDITGRKGHRNIDVSMRIVLTVDGKRYALSTQELRCFEDGDLAVKLPDKALTLGAV